MIDLNILKEHGLTDDALKKWFEGDPKDWPKKREEFEEADHRSAHDKRISLQNRIRSRIQEGMQRNWEDYRVFSALDKAWDQPFYQITPSIIAQFVDSDPNSEDVKKQMDSWGMAHLLQDDVDPKSGKAVKKLNLPVFFKIFVPLVRAYVTIRWAKIMNDRRQTPFFKYEPFKQTTPLRLKCEAITDRVNIISNQYGYYDVMKQAVHKMLLYSYCIQFVAKEWDFEEQWQIAGEDDVAMGKTKASATKEDPDKREPAAVGDKIKSTTREGLSYHLPHPTRTFVDISAGKHTINYDYGVRFGGYWKIMRYREVKEQGFWNTQAVSLGSVDIISSQDNFFRAAYSSAHTIKYPVFAPPQPSSGPAGAAAEMGVGVTPHDREKQMANQYYGIEHDDQGVLVTEYFEKLIPKDNGLGTYDCPVWFRFVVAGDGATIMYAAPLPFNPMIYFGYDADESRSKNPSLGLEVLPFQDHFTNTLSQIIYTAKQNLANLAMIDTDQLETGEIDRLRNLGGNMFQGVNVVGFSGKRAYRGQNKVTDVLHKFDLPKGDVAELTNVLKSILDVLERILVMSSQEVAQAASHEQTREEVRTIAASTSTRLQFTATPVDIATAAWKRQLYQGVMAYGDDDMWSALPSDIPLTKEQLEKFGFTFVDKDEEIVKKDRFRRVTFKKKSTAMDMWTFASTRDDIDRSSDREVAVAMASIVRDLMNNPITATAIGPDQAIDLANQIARLAGLPRDFKLRNMAPDLNEEQMRQQKLEELKAVVDTVMKEIQPMLKQTLEPMLQKDVEHDQMIQNNTAQMALMMPVLGDIMGRLQIQPPPGMIPNGEPVRGLVA